MIRNKPFPTVDFDCKRMLASLLCALATCFIANSPAGEFPPEVRQSLSKKWDSLKEEQPPNSADWTETEKFRYAIYHEILRSFNGVLPALPADIVAAEDQQAIASWPKLDQQRYARYVLKLRHQGMLKAVGKTGQQEVLERLSEADRAMFSLFLEADRARALAAYRKAILKNPKGDDDPPVAVEDQETGQDAGTTATAMQAPGDELLAAALQAYLDDDQPRTKAIQHFSAYLEQFPRTPFAAEIHTMLGNLYGTHRRNGESLEIESVQKHYEIAHQLYGRKFSVEHAAVWGTMANRSDRLVDAFAGYLEWLNHLKVAGTAVDVWPVRTIAMYLKGHPPELTDDERAQRMAWVKNKLLKDYLWSAEENLLARATENREALAVIAKRFAKIPLGLRARKMLDLQPARTTDTNPDPESEPPAEPDSGATGIRVPDAPEKTPNGNSGEGLAGLRKWGGMAIAVLAVFGMLVLLKTRRTA